MKDSTQSPNKPVVAIVWYRPEQWQRVRDIAADSHEFEGSYVECLQLAEEKAKELKGRGLRVEKVDLDSEKLILWCNERGLENNGQARSRYAAERLAELEEKRSLISERT
jgi:predicted RNA-binding protein